MGLRGWRGKQPTPVLLAVIVLLEEFSHRESAHLANRQRTERAHLQEHGQVVVVEVGEREQRRAQAAAAQTLPVQIAGRHVQAAVVGEKEQRRAQAAAEQALLAQSAGRRGMAHAAAAQANRLLQVQVRAVVAAVVP